MALPPGAVPGAIRAHGAREALRGGGDGCPVGEERQKDRKHVSLSPSLHVPGIVSI